MQKSNELTVVSSWAEQFFQEYKHSEASDQRYQNLLLLVDKSQLNIKGINLTPEDVEEMMKLIVEIDESYKFQLPNDTCLGMTAIKMVMLQKLAKHPRTTNIRWQSVVSFIKKKRPIWQKKDEWYGKILNYASVLT